MLFARGDYGAAAGAVYSVLSAGPGWDWPTLRGLYADPETYTRQLRALEKAQKDNPEDPPVPFLLAYHYLTLGATDAAVKELEVVGRLSPKDELSANLLKMLKESKDKGGDRPPGPG